MAAYLEEVKSTRSVPNPPPGPVRTMAEWEEIQALLITWSGQNAILREIVRHAQGEVKVIIITNNPSGVENSLLSNDIPVDNVEFLNVPFNSIWIRDYGPWAVYENDVDSLMIVDWIYNRPRPNDNLVPVRVAEYLNLPIYEATNDPDDWVHTGGNHLPDGMGTTFSSWLVLEENPDKTEGLIDTIANTYLGTKPYIKFPTLPYDGIHHLDMHIRLLDEETIMVGQYPEGVADGPQIEANLQYLLEEFKTPYGTPYKVVRIPMPPDGNGRYPDQNGNYRTYTNSIFLNKTILVPTYEDRYDTTALRIYRENLPGYNVVGINCNSIIPSLGALHCITKTVGVHDPLYITHPQLRDTENDTTGHEIVATIKHRSGIESASLHFKSSLDSFYLVTEMVIDSATGLWHGVIPAYAKGTEIQYFIEATAVSGKTQVRPIVAPEGYYHFRINGEFQNQPPTVRITDPIDQSILAFYWEPVPVLVEAGDPDGVIMEATLFVNQDSVSSVTTAPFEFAWEPEMPGTYALEVRVTDNFCAQVMSDPVEVMLEDATSTAGPDGNKCSIYPNPSRDYFWLNNCVGMEAVGDIFLTNLLGQRMPVPVGQIGQSYRVDVSDLTPGVYGLHWGVGRESVKRVIVH